MEFRGKIVERLGFLPPPFIVSFHADALRRN